LELYRRATSSEFDIHIVGMPSHQRTGKVLLQREINMKYAIISYKALKYEEEWTPLPTPWLYMLCSEFSDNLFVFYNINGWAWEINILI
jgi:hypothetical protein